MGLLLKTAESNPEKIIKKYIDINEESGGIKKSA